MKNVIFISLFASLLMLTGSCDKVEKLGPFICPPDNYTFSAEQMTIEGLTNLGEVDLSFSII